ncbi:MAG: hypothetical protein RL189_1830 [Pseudomonadota bacterium]
MTITTKWLSADEIAKHPRISKETVYHWLGRGIIPDHKGLRFLKFKAAEVIHWVQKSEASELPIEYNDSAIQKKGMGKSE